MQRISLRRFRLQCDGRTLEPSLGIQSMPLAPTAFHVWMVYQGTHQGKHLSEVEGQRIYDIRIRAIGIGIRLSHDKNIFIKSTSEASF